MSVQLVTRRFTVDDFYRMAKVGILTEDDRVELVEGQIVEMAPIGDRHAADVARLTSVFGAQLAGRAIVLVQNPLRLDPPPSPFRTSFFSGRAATTTKVVAPLLLASSCWLRSPTRQWCTTEGPSSGSTHGPTFQRCGLKT